MLMPFKYTESLKSKNFATNQTVMAQLERIYQLTPFRQGHESQMSVRFLNIKLYIFSTLLTGLMASLRTSGVFLLLVMIGASCDMTSNETRESYRKVKAKLLSHPYSVDKIPPKVLPAENIDISLEFFPQQARIPWSYTPRNGGLVNNLWLYSQKPWISK